MSAVDALNLRFTNGGPSDTIEHGGLLVHMFDNLQDPIEPWHVCRTGWCSSGWVEHLSCSLINHQVPALYTYTVGFILSAQVPFVCAYPSDGGTQGRPMGGCYEKAACSSTHWWGCQFPANDLYSAIETQIAHNSGSYSEYVVATTDWEANLPHTIEAIVCRDDCESAKAIHLAFLSTYNQTASDTPLVYYDQIGFTEMTDHLG